jgi:hypothetical protein
MQRLRKWGFLIFELMRITANHGASAENRWTEDTNPAAPYKSHP